MDDTNITIILIIILTDLSKTTKHYLFLETIEHLFYLLLSKLNKHTNISVSSSITLHQGYLFENIPSERSE
nr:MAG TPA: hypothetical protein [Caudoviricetes sp.]